MPLVSILDELEKARRNSYAIPCFDTFDRVSAQATWTATTTWTCSPARWRRSAASGRRAGTSGRI